MKAAKLHKQEPVANLYAKALFQLAQEKNEVDHIEKDFTSLTQTLEESPVLRQALSAVMFSADEREKIAGDLAQKTQLHPLLARFVQLLTSKNRAQLIEPVYRAYRELVDESKNIMRGTVTTVEPLSQAELADLSKTFAQKFNKQVLLDLAIDKDILGGLVVQVHGLTFDGSLRTTISRLKENLERQSI